MNYMCSTCTQLCYETYYFIQGREYCSEECLAKKVGEEQHV